MNLLFKCGLVVVLTCIIDVLVLLIAGNSGVVSVVVAYVLLLLSVLIMGFLGFKYIIIPIIKLYNALVIIDFDQQSVDLGRIDSLEPFKVSELQIIQDKFKYLIDRLAERINRVNQAISEGEHDELSGCYNKARLAKYMYSYQNSRDGYCIIFIDVNNLKKMNDINGHDAGDALIQTAANKLNHWKTYGDVYRIGGDEFMVVIPNKSEQYVTEVWNNWYPTVGILNRASDGFKCVLSYGIAWGYRGSDFEEVRKIADDRMYECKKAIKQKFGETMR